MGLASFALLGLLATGCGDGGAQAPSTSSGAGRGASGGATTQAGQGAGGAGARGGSSTMAGRSGASTNGGAMNGTNGGAMNGTNGGAMNGASGMSGALSSGGEMSAGRGGATSEGGRASMASGGMTLGGRAGSSGTAGAPGGSSSGGSGGPTSGCGGINMYPFGCKLAWGIADPGGGSYAGYSYLDFMSYWVDSSISASGTYATCNGCNWLEKLKSTPLIPVYVAYVIGFLGHSNGLADGNQTGTKKLTTDGAQLIRDHRQAIVDAYAWYADKSHAAWPDKPLVWMLEGDFVQYADAAQTNPLTFDELAALAADITCAIKSKMPNAVVAIDQSSWNSDETTNSFWGALAKAQVNYDMVWTTGVGNNDGYIESGTNGQTYNHTTANYAYLHELTGRTVMVDTSAGISAAGDSWSIASADQLDARIAEGVIAADITGNPPGNLQSNLSALRPELDGLPSCP